jgi:hypothetical protein
MDWKAFSFGKGSYMSNEKTANISAVNGAVPLPMQGYECPALVKKIGKTTYRVIHFSTTSRETMSDKIKRMLRNEVQHM